MATKNDTDALPQVHYLPISSMAAVKQPPRRRKLPAEVASLDEARESKFARLAAEAASQEAVARSLRSDIDQVTRDLHAAASSTLKLLYLARDRMELPQL